MHIMLDIIQSWEYPCFAKLCLRQRNLLKFQKLISINKYIFEVSELDMYIIGRQKTSVEIYLL